MKTINSKLQKAGLETIIVLTVLMATCFTLSAQGAQFENSYSGNGELALFEMRKKERMAIRKHENANEMAYFNEFLEKEKEAELAIESWMTEEAVFGVVELESDFEDGLKVEDWMINDDLFKSAETEINNEKPNTEKVEKRKVAVGVTIPGAQFGRRTLILIEMDDPKLELENWMVDTRIWNTKKQ